MQVKNNCLVFFVLPLFRTYKVILSVFSSRLSTYIGDRLPPHKKKKEKNSGTNHFVQAYKGKLLLISGEESVVGKEKLTIFS